MSSTKDLATAAYRKKDFVTAEQLYRQAFDEDNKTNILCLNNIAAVFLEMKQYEKAAEIAEEALEKASELRCDFEVKAKIMNRLGRVYHVMADQLVGFNETEHKFTCDTLVKDDAEKALGHYETSKDWYAKSLLENSDRKVRAAQREVIVMIDKVKAQMYIDPVLGEEHRTKGNKFFAEKNFPAAKSEYDEAIKRNPKDVKSYSNRAAAYTNLLEYPCALKDCEKGLEIDPTFIKLYNRKALCYMKMKDYLKAEETYKAALEIDANNTEAQNGLMNVMMTVQQKSQGTEVDPEQYQRAMQDPKVQQILSDPQMQILLQQMGENPAIAAQAMNDPTTAEKIHTLMAAGILRMM